MEPICSKNTLRCSQTSRSRHFTTVTGDFWASSLPLMILKPSPLIFTEWDASPSTGTTNAISLQETRPRTADNPSEGDFSLPTAPASSGLTCTSRSDEPGSVLRPFPCPQCPKIFTTKGRAGVHYRAVHLRERPCKCDVCETSFSGASSLKRHMRLVHLKERLSHRDECGATCQSPATFKRHVRLVHLKERLFKCDACGTTDQTAQNLKKPMNSYSLARTSHGLVRPSTFT
jgi:hypothetical protein